MVAQCATPIKARVARLVKLTDCGVPVSGTGSAVVVTKGWTQTSVTPEYEDGQEFLTLLVTGEPCVNQKDPAFLKRAVLETQWCILDPDALVIITGDQLLTTSAVTGTGVAFGEGQITTRFSLEVWQPLAGVGACDPSGNQRYVYWAFPNLGNAKVGNFAFANATFNFITSAETQAMATQWGLGPGNTHWIQTTPEEGTHFLYNITTTAPPAPSCGAVALPGGP